MYSKWLPKWLNAALNLARTLCSAFLYSVLDPADDGDGAEVLRWTPPIAVELSDL